jgi:tRNA threonylcarbamoyladenosine biosynthesis protein TsaE
VNQIVTKSPEETSTLGRQWGAQAEPGWVIGLIGELGAGKTQLVKGVAAGLDISDRVHSPTFALVHQYTRGRIPLVHIDLYRLDTASQVIGAGLEQFIYDPTVIVVIEWIDRWSSGDAAPTLGAGALYRKVQLEILDPMSRRIRYEDTRT